MTSHSNKNPSDFGNRLLVAMKNNPEGLLLLAAGCALLVRRGDSPRADAFYQSGQTAASAETALSQTSSEASRQVQAAADSVKDTASSYSDSVKDTASAYVATASKSAGYAGRAVKTRSGDLAQQAQETILRTFNGIAQGQPLLVVGIGLGLGAAVAAVLPASQLEKRSLRPVGESLSGAATVTTERLKAGTTAASQRLKGAADERGFSVEGLKEMANETADAFGKAFSGSDVSKPDEGGHSSRIQDTSSGREPVVQAGQSRPDNTEPSPTAKPWEAQS